MNSCLYECSVRHHRLWPREHQFQHGIFMFYLDLDELDQLSKGILGFSRNRFNLYDFRDQDHVPTGSSAISAKERLVGFLKMNGVVLDPRARIMLLTLPRVLGYVFNPVSFYFCFEPTGEPVCAIAEVGNTFGEMKLYLLKREDRESPEKFRKQVRKHFYVSPFSGLDLSFDFKLRLPGDQLEIHVDDRDGETPVLLSTLAGSRLPLTSGRLAWLSLKFPMVTLKVIFLIHWHALRLWLKRVPFHRKADKPALQIDVLRPNPSSLPAHK